MTLRPAASDRLSALVDERGPSCLGFDPRPAWHPAECVPADRSPEAAASAIRKFFSSVLDAAGSSVAAIKLQAAFFERWLAPGFTAFTECCREATKRGYFVVADVKRGDIGTTAEAYAEAYLSPVDGPPLADAVTVSPYLGSDGVKPFFASAAAHGGMTFTLVKTSNPSSSELQDLIVDGAAISDRVARLVESEASRTIAGGKYGAAGAVVGATHPRELARFRALMPHAWLLLPGYGAQGAGAEDVREAFDRKGLGALVTASRSLTYPWGSKAPPADWRGAIRAAAVRMRGELLALRTGAGE